MKVKKHWVITTIVDGENLYWTGNIPHISIKESESGLQMWTSNFHEANKYEIEEMACIANDGFEVYGEVIQVKEVIVDTKQSLKLTTAVVVSITILLAWLATILFITKLIN